MSEKIAGLPSKTKLRHYKIQKIIGSGGFGITYLATDIKTGKKVVIKENIPGKDAARPAGKVKFNILTPGDVTVRGSAAWAESNFMREAETLRAIRHSNVVTVLDIFKSEETNTAYYVMPFIESASLQSLIDKSFEPTYDWLNYILCSLLETLYYVHGKGLLHRDIKPANILIKNDGSPILIDFGSARGMSLDERTRMITHGYSPAEQMKGVNEGAWSDLYALGATMYCIITGTPPPDAYSRIDGDECKILSQDSKLVQKYGYKMLAGIDCALRVGVDKRFRSALEWLRYMEHEAGFQSATPIIPPILLADLARRAGAKGSRVTIEGRGGKSIVLEDGIIMMDDAGKESSRKWLRWLLLLLLLLLFLGLLLWYLFRPQTKSSPEPSTHVTAPPIRVSLPTDSTHTVPPDETDKGKEKPELITEKANEKAEVRLLARPETKLRKQDGSVKKRVDGKDEYVRHFGVYYSDGTVYDGLYAVHETLQDYKNQNEPVGYFREEDVYVWPHNISMQYALTSLPDINRVLYFEDLQGAQKFRELSDEEQFWVRHAVCQYADNMLTGSALRIPEQAPTAYADVEQTCQNYTICAIEASEMAERSYSYMLPILEYHKQKNRGRTELSYVKLAAATPVYQKTEDFRTQQVTQIQEAYIDIAPVDICFVVDTTRSMRPFMEKVKDRILQTVAEEYNIDNFSIDLNDETEPTSLEKAYIRTVLKSCRDAVNNGTAGDKIASSKEYREKIFIRIPGYKPICLETLMSQSSCIKVERDAAANGLGGVRYGLVAYRDWMYNSKPNARETLTFQNGLVQDGFGHGDTKEEEQESRYLVHNFNQSVGRMLSTTEMSDVVTSAPFREATEDSVDFCEDVQAGLHEARKNIPWTDRSVRFVILVGDAPGREPGAAEPSDLEVGSERVWARRAHGSSTGLSPETVAENLKDSGISVISWWFEPKRVLLQNGTPAHSDKAWNQFVETASAQFDKYVKLTNPVGQVSDRLTLMRTQDFVESVQSEANGENISNAELANKVRESMARRFAEELGETMSKAVKEEIRVQTEKAFKATAVMQVAGESVQLGSARDLESALIESFGTQRGSAERSLFGVGYVQRLEESDNSAWDISAWTPVREKIYMDSNNPAGCSKSSVNGMSPCIVLSREQVDTYINALSKVCDLYRAATPDDEVEKNHDEFVGHAATLTGSNMHDPQDIEKSLEELRKQLPYSTWLISNFSAENVDGTKIQYQIARISQTLDRLRDSVNAADYDSLRNADTEQMFWIKAADGNSSNDVLVIPIKYLP